MAERLRRTLEPAGVEVDLSDARTPEPWAGTPAQGRYTEVSE